MAQRISDINITSNICITLQTVFYTTTLNNTLWVSSDGFRGQGDGENPYNSCLAHLRQRGAIIVYKKHICTVSLAWLHVQVRGHWNQASLAQAGRLHLCSACIPLGAYTLMSDGRGILIWRIENWHALTQTYQNISNNFHRICPKLESNITMASFIKINSKQTPTDMYMRTHYQLTNTVTNAHLNHMHSNANYRRQLDTRILTHTHLLKLSMIGV